MGFGGYRETVEIVDFVGFVLFGGHRETVEIVDFVGNVAGCGYALLMTLRLPVALSVSFADSSPTGGAKSTPVGVG